MLRMMLLLGLLLPTTAHAQFSPLLGSLMGQLTGGKEAPYELIEGRVADNKARLKAYSDSLRLTSLELNRQPDSARLYLRRGLLRVEMGLATEGKQDLLTAREKGVAYPRYDLALGKAYFALAAKKAALESFDRQIARTPDDPQPYYYRAVTELYHHPSNYSAGLTTRAERALPELNRTVTAFPDFRRARLMRGYVQLTLQHYPEALTDLQAVLVVEPDNEMARLLLGQTYLAQGANAEACREFGQLRSADPKELKKLLKQACGS